MEQETWSFIKNIILEYRLLFDLKQFPKNRNILKSMDLKTYLGYYQVSHINKELLYILELPITGITHKQALDFCEWRTLLFSKDKFIYKLPNKIQWEIIARSILKNQKKSNQVDSLIENNIPNYNFKDNFYSLNQNSINKSHPIAFFPNKGISIFDFWGNVSEMSDREGLALGGNYNLYASQIDLNEIQFYTKPEKWLGFRCIYVKSNNYTKIDLDNYENTQNNYLDKRDNSYYKIVTINNQIWMAENLHYLPINKTYWVCPNNDNNYKNPFYLYDWETAKDVCPNGWHLPSKDDVNNLIGYINAEGKNEFKELTIGGNYGFDIITSCVFMMGDFTPSDGGTSFWLSTEANKNKAYGMGVGFETKRISVNNNYRKKWGLSVRCIKD